MRIPAATPCSKGIPMKIIILFEVSPGTDITVPLGHCVDDPSEHFKEDNNTMLHKNATATGRLSPYMCIPQVVKWKDFTFFFLACPLWNIKLQRVTSSFNIEYSNHFNALLDKFMYRRAFNSADPVNMQTSNLSEVAQMALV